MKFIPDKGQWIVSDKWNVRVRHGPSQEANEITCHNAGTVVSAEDIVTVEGSEHKWIKLGENRYMMTYNGDKRENMVQRMANRPSTFYHATNLNAVLAIQDAGFRVPAGSGGCLGPGIYCTTTLRKAFDHLECEHGGIIFELNVDLGRCKILHQDDPEMKTWHQDYDSAWHPTGAVNRVEEGKEENCVKDPCRIKIVRPIAGHTGKNFAAGYDIVGNRLVRR
jgi:hypothetical protein